MVTAGHCIENPFELSYESKRFAKGTDTRCTVKGSERAPADADLCKPDCATRWTCGTGES